jgi:cytochrome c553
VKTDEQMHAAGPRQFGGVAIAAVAAIAVAAFAVGFFVMPTEGPRASVWLRICRAAGVVRAPRLDSGGVAAAGHTTVVMPQAALVPGTPDESGHGATLSLRCTMCHGAQGRSGADAPNLAGQYADAVYKQLVDFQRGARVNAVMGAMTAALTEQDMLDLGHYYAGLPRSNDEHLASAPALVRVGDPMRNIAPCASCHGRVDGKIGAPVLEGEPRAYLDKQLTAFRDGSRANDMNAAMRSEARLLTQADIATLVDHYAATGPL